MALYRLLCTLGQHNLVSVLLKCHLPLPAYILTDEKHSKCLTERVYLPTIVSGQVIWHLGYSDAKSAVTFTESYASFNNQLSNMSSRIGCRAPSSMALTAPPRVCGPCFPALA